MRMIQGKAYHVADTPIRIHIHLSCAPSVYKIKPLWGHPKCCAACGGSSVASLRYVSNQRKTEIGNDRLVVGINKDICLGID
jgi:hypothetical protein